MDPLFWQTWQVKFSSIVGVLLVLGAWWAKEAASARLIDGEMSIEGLLRLWFSVDAFFGVNLAGSCAGVSPFSIAGDSWKGKLEVLENGARNC